MWVSNNDTNPFLVIAVIFTVLGILMGACVVSTYQYANKHLDVSVEVK